MESIKGLFGWINLTMGKKQKKQKKSPFMKSVWAPLVVVPSLMILLLVIHYTIQKNPNVERIISPSFEYPNGEELEIVLRRVFEDHEISWEESRKSVWRVRVPSDLPIPSLHLAIQ